MASHSPRLSMLTSTILSDRQYFMLDEATVFQKVFDSCDVPCQADRILPKEVLQFTTETIPDKLGQFFNADVMEESNQKILVIRKNLTILTDYLIIKNQADLQALTWQESFNQS